MRERSTPSARCTQGRARARATVAVVAVGARGGGRGEGRWVHQAWSSARPACAAGGGGQAAGQLQPAPGSSWGHGGRGRAASQAAGPQGVGGAPLPPLLLSILKCERCPHLVKWDAHTSDPLPRHSCLRPGGPPPATSAVASSLPRLSSSSLSPHPPAPSSPTPLQHPSPTPAHPPVLLHPGACSSRCRGVPG